MFVMRYDIVLIENVKGAPWEKMQAYINGTVNLKVALKAFVSSQKGGEKTTEAEKATAAKDKKDAVKETLFEVTESKVTKGKLELVTVSVARVTGIRLDAVLQGYREQGGATLQTVNIKRLGLKKGGTIELKMLAHKLGLCTKTDKTAAGTSEHPSATRTLSRHMPRSEARHHIPLSCRFVFAMPAKYHTKVIKVDSKRLLTALPSCFPYSPAHLSWLAWQFWLAADAPARVLARVEGRDLQEHRTNEGGRAVGGAGPRAGDRAQPPARDFHAPGLVRPAAALP